MKIILRVLFLVLVQYCAGDDRSAFDWNFKTMERGSDFADNSKVQTFDKNDFQKNFFHIPDKTSNEDNSFDKSFLGKMDNKYDWKPNDEHFKKKFDYNERNPFSFSQKPFFKNVPDFEYNSKVQTFDGNEFQKTTFQSPSKMINNDNIFDKTFFRKMDNKYGLKANDGNFKKQFDYNERNPFSFSEKPFIQNENRHDEFKTNSIFSQNTDNDRRYPGDNNYDDNRDKNNVFNSYSKYNYYKESNRNKDNNNNHYDNDGKTFKMSNITSNNQNQDKHLNRNEDNKSNFFIPFLSHRFKNATSNIVCDKYDQKDGDKVTTQKDIQTEPPKDNEKDTEKEKEDKKDKQKEDPYPDINCNGKYNMEGFVGTNLIDNTAKRCFSTEEVALLTARRDFESLIPKNLPQCLFNDRMVEVLFNYFYACHQMIIGTTSDGLMRLTQKAFYDTLGGYLNYYMVPVAKYSYYAGQISLRTAQQVLILYHQCKGLLNTNGNGWRAPIQDVLLELKSIQIEPLHIPPLNEDSCDEPSFCMHLDLITEECQPHDDNMIVRLPKLESESLNGFLGNIWLPFRRKRIFDLKADSSAYVLVKFYETVTKCYRYENIDQTYYNNQFKSWLMENIHSHLSDEQFYPGLGAVLRIYEYLNRIKKDTSAYRGHNNMQQTKHIKRANNKILHNNAKILIDYDLFNNSQTNRKPNDGLQRNIPNKVHSEILSKDIVNQQQKPLEKTVGESEISSADSTNPKIDLRARINLTPVQALIIGIPVCIFTLLVIICCYKSFFKKKKPVQKKHSSSSSSNLFNSPVRFFHVRGKSVSDYSPTEPGAKKGKKSVKIDKSSVRSSTSASSSPVRNKSKGKPSPKK